MFEKVCHIGPALDVQGGISSVLASYKKLFELPDENFMPSYNGSFIRSLPLFVCLCLKLLFCPPDVPCFQIHTSFNGSFFRKFLISLCLRLRRKKYVVHVHGSRFIRMCETSPKFVQRFIRCYFRHSAMVVCITPDMQEFYDSNAEQINDLLQTIDVFDGIRDKIAAIDPDELQTMEGMSKEAYDIYRNVAQQLQASAPNDAVKRSAKAGAALLARRADRFAEAMRAAGLEVTGMTEQGEWCCVVGRKKA